jgi:hypothetical protein
MSNESEHAICNEATFEAERYFCAFDAIMMAQPRMQRLMHKLNQA